MLAQYSTPALVDFAWDFYSLVHKVYRINPTLYEIMMLVRVGKASVSRWVADFAERDILEQRPGKDGRSFTIHQTATSIARMERWADEVRCIVPIVKMRSSDLSP